MVLNDLYFEKPRLPKPTWCKSCGRKHSRKTACELRLVEDLTTKRYTDEVLSLAPEPQKEWMEKEEEAKRVGFYTTRKSE